MIPALRADGRRYALADLLLNIALWPTWRLVGPCEVKFCLFNHRRLLIERTGYHDYQYLVKIQTYNILRGDGKRRVAAGKLAGQLVPLIYL